MAIVSEDIPEGQGANASMAFGDATRSAALLKEAQTAGGSAGAGNPGGPLPPPQGSPPGPQGPVQPPPGQPPGQQPLGSRDVRPGGRTLDMQSVFPPLPGQQDNQPWRQRLAALADHPQAGPYLRLLSDLAHRRRQPGAPPPQGPAGGAGQ